MAVMKAKLVNIRKRITEQNTKYHYAPFKSTSQILYTVPAPDLKKFTVELEQIDRRARIMTEYMNCSTGGELNRL